MVRVGWEGHAGVTSGQRRNRRVSWRAAGQDDCHCRTRGTPCLSSLPGRASLRSHAEVCARPFPQIRGARRSPPGAAHSTQIAGCQPVQPGRGLRTDAADRVLRLRCPRRPLTAVPSSHSRARGQNHLALGQTRTFGRSATLAVRPTGGAIPGSTPAAPVSRVRQTKWHRYTRPGASLQTLPSPVPRAVHNRNGAGATGPLCLGKDGGSAAPFVSGLHLSPPVGKRSTLAILAQSS